MTEAPNTMPAVDEQRLREILSAATGAPDGRTETLDSFHFINLLMALEEAFDIHIPEDAVDRARFADFATILREITRLQGGPDHG